jgi:4-hydroxy-tetrahydrodipicolinate synthase
MLIGTGTCSLAETEQLTRHAINCGAAGVLVMPPFYYRKVNEDGLFRYFATLFERIGEPFHLYLYHFPAMSGIEISMELLERLITAFPERFIGIKDSSGDPEHMLEILKRFPDFRLYSGTERLLVDTLQNGSQGCISATTNYSIAHAATVYEKFISGQDYSAESDKMLSSRKAFEGNVLAAAVKGILHMHSGNPNWQNLRPPLTLPEGASLETIFAELQSIA